MNQTLKHIALVASFLALSIASGCATLSLDGGATDVSGFAGDNGDILAVMAADSQSGE